MGRGAVSGDGSWFVFDLFGATTAVVEATYTTVVVEPGYELEVDPTSNLVISKP